MSQITVINQTNETVRIAIFKKSILRPTLGAIAWRVIAPPPGGQHIVQVPSDHSVFAEYSSAPGEPTGLHQQTRTLHFAETSARFEIHSLSDDSSQAEISQKFDDLVWNEVRIDNHFGVGVWAHLQLDGADIYPPQVLWPGGLLMEDIRSSLYLTVVSQFTQPGQRLVQEETSLTETQVLEGGTATVTGSMWKGYSIKVY